MKNIYIWGTANGFTRVLESIDIQKVRVLNCVDINKNKTVINGYEIIHPDDMDFDVDYVIVAAVIKFPEIKETLLCKGYDEGKILCYYDVFDKNISLDIDFINHALRISTLMEIKYEVEFSKLRNLEYEIADKLRNNEYLFPIIKSGEECLKKIAREKLSLCRFGDGEFEMMQGRVRPEFQMPDENLGKRLVEILNSSKDSVLIAIADNYGSLDKYTENAQKGIRKYLSPSVREEHMDLLELSKTYYDAYVSRPYIIYKDKTYAQKIFDLWKLVWHERDVIIVEGELSRCGYRNDLFKSAKSVERILCPAKNVWNQYDEILSYIKNNISKNKLILIALGPTATVLAYDLSNLGYQAIDIGQVDNEYEWFQRKVESRVNVSYKYVSECGAIGQSVDYIEDDELLSQIIVKIGVGSSE